MERRRLIQGLLSGVAALRLGETFAQDGGPVAPIDPALAERMQTKAKHFDQDFADDAYLTADQNIHLSRLVEKIAMVRKAVGYGRFNLISFDDLLYRSARTASGALTRSELDFIEALFFRDAKDYGFYGIKVSPQLTTRVDESRAIKVPGTGHYLFRGQPEVLYAELKKDIGSDIVLTSGIRSIVKQLDLFMNKTLLCKGNLSRASRSLAPPGYSFHGSGDFDVGKVGLGANNFTDSFAATDVYKRLIDLGYVNIRYTQSNFYGVRFEPWHIKVS